MKRHHRIVGARLNRNVAPRSRGLELIAANQSIEGIRKFVEADSLAYLSLGSLRKAVSDAKDEYCYACYTGEYPTELVQIEELVAARTRR